MSDLSSKFILDVIPNEIVYYILSFLDSIDLCQVGRVSHLFRTLSLSSSLWKRLCIRKWPEQFSKFSTGKNVHPFSSLDQMRGRGRDDEDDDQTFWKDYYTQKYLLEEREDSLSWQQLPLSSSACGIKPTPRYAHTGSTIDNNVIYIGGQLAQKIRYNDIFFYNTENGHFTQPKIRGCPPNLSKHTAVDINGLVYVFGGYDGLSQRFELAVFDPKNLAWEVPTTTGNCPTSRSNHAAAAIKDKMYIFGGLLQQGTSLIDSNDLYVLDTKTMVWSKPNVTGDLPEVRCGHKLVSIDNKLYMFGGGSGDNWSKKFNQLYCFDPETDTWSLPEASGISVDSTTFASCFNLGKFLFVFGGGKYTHRGQVSNDVFIYDTVTQHWSKQRLQGTPPVERDDCTTNVLGDTVYFMHGYNSGPMDEFWSMKLSPSLYRSLYKKSPPKKIVKESQSVLSLSPSLKKMKQKLSQLTLSPFSRRTTHPRS